MKNLKYIENQKPVAEVQYLKEKELTDKEIAEQWIKSIYLDPNAKFNGDREVWCSSCSVGDPGYGKTFTLSITLKNMTGDSRSDTANNTDEANEIARKIEAAEGYWKGSDSGFKKENRETLASNIRQRINEHRTGNSIVGSCYVAGKMFGREVRNY